MPFARVLCVHVLAHVLAPPILPSFPVPVYRAAGPAGASRSYLVDYIDVDHIEVWLYKNLVLRSENCEPLDTRRP